MTVDSAALIPVVTTAESSPTSNSTFDVSVDFGETVTGFIDADLALINGTVSNFADAGNGFFTATIRSIADGQVTFFVPAGAAQDAAKLRGFEIIGELTCFREHLILWGCGIHNGTSKKCYPPEI